MSLDRIIYPDIMQIIDFLSFKKMSLLKPSAIRKA